VSSNLPFPVCDVMITGPLTIVFVWFS